MWAFDKDTRPDAVIYSFLPMSFLTGAIGGYLQFRSEREYALTTKLKTPV